MKLFALIFKYCLVSVVLSAITYLFAFIPGIQKYKLVHNYILFFYPVILTIICIKEFKDRKLLKREKLLIAISITIITTLSVMVIGLLNLAGFQLNEGEKRMGGPVGISLHFGFIIFILTTIACFLTHNKVISNKELYSNAETNENRV